MTQTFLIPYPETPKGRVAWNKQYGMNAIYAGKHWSVRKRDAEYWHWITVSAINRAGLRDNPFEEPVVIKFFWNSRMDLSNHAYMAKLIEDGMKGRLIIDDGPKYVRGIDHRYHDEPYIKVVIEEEKTHGYEAEA